MQGGDIDNGTPKRVLVHLDILVQERPEVTKFLGIVPVVRSRAYYDRLVLNRLWQFTSKSGVNLELFDTGCTEDDMSAVMEDLESFGTNPFRWARTYDSITQLMDDMPYRPEVLGVVDVSSRALMYGSKYYDLGRV